MHVSISQQIPYANSERRESCELLVTNARQTSSLLARLLLLAKFRVDALLKREVLSHNCMTDVWGDSEEDESTNKKDLNAEWSARKAQFYNVSRPMLTPQFLCRS